MNIFGGLNNKWQQKPFKKQQQLFVSISTEHHKTQRKVFDFKK